MVSERYSTGQLIDYRTIESVYKQICMFVTFKFERKVKDQKCLQKERQKYGNSGVQPNSHDY